MKIFLVFTTMFLQNTDYSNFLGKSIHTIKSIELISDSSSLQVYKLISNNCGDTNIRLFSRSGEVVKIKMTFKRKKFASIVENHISMYGTPDGYYKYDLPTISDFKNSDTTLGARFSEGFSKLVPINYNENPNVAIWFRKDYTIKVINNIGNDRIYVQME